jgi:hypothetical protein
MSTRSLEPTNDGGCIAAAIYSADFLVVKMSSSGAVEWARSYGGIWGEKADYVQQTSDGGYVVVGLTTTFSDPLITPFGVALWVLKLSPVGDIQWQRSYWGIDESAWLSDSERMAILETPDRGFILACTTSEYGAGRRDIWLLKLLANGEIEWQHTYGGMNDEAFPPGGPHIQLTADGGYIVAARTLSSGAINPGTDYQHYDLWLLKLFPSGEIESQRTYGGILRDEASSIRTTFDGGYIVAGTTLSFGVNGSDVWLLKFSPTGGLEWSRTYGGDGAQIGNCVIQASDGGFVIAGTHKLPASIGTAGNGNLFLLKTTNQGDIGTGCGLVGAPDVLVQDTNVTPQDTFVQPVLTDCENGAIVNPEDVFFRDMNLVSEILCESSNKPPINLVLEREINRGLFSGEAFNYLSWQPDPWNSRFVIREYKIYRSPVNAVDYQLIGKVDGNIFMYTDGYLKMEDKFAYVVTSVDSDGNESPKSKPVRNE